VKSWAASGSIMPRGTAADENRKAAVSNVVEQNELGVKNEGPRDLKTGIQEIARQSTKQLPNQEESV
jgi:hypothetical protein